MPKGLKIQVYQMMHGHSESKPGAQWMVAATHSPWTTHTHVSTCQKSLTDLSQNTEARSWNDFDFYCPEVKLDLKFPSW